VSRPRRLEAERRSARTEHARGRARDRVGLAESLHRLASYLLQIGFHSHAAEHAQHALALCREDGNRVGEAACLVQAPAPLAAARPHCRTGPPRLRTVYVLALCLRSPIARPTPPHPPPSLPY
jgi:hypothetical protein